MSSIGTGIIGSSTGLLGHLQMLSHALRRLNIDSDAFSGMYIDAFTDRSIVHLLMPLLPCQLNDSFIDSPPPQMMNRLQKLHCLRIFLLGGPASYIIYKH